MKLRDKIIKEIDQISSMVSPDSPLEEGEFSKLLYEFFEGIFGGIYVSLKKYRGIASQFYLPSLEEEEGIQYVNAPGGWPSKFRSRIIGVANAPKFKRAVLISVKQSYRTETKKEIPVLDVDESKPLIDEGHQVFKKGRGALTAVCQLIMPDHNRLLRATDLTNDNPSVLCETKDHDVVIVYCIPLAFFVDLLTEIGRTSLINPVDDNYIPKPLGVNVMPLYRSAYIGYREPFRIFLKPEKGTDRLEVIVESYDKEEVKENLETIDKRRRWKDFQISDTETMKKLLKRIKEKEFENASLSTSTLTTPNEDSHD